MAVTLMPIYHDFTLAQMFRSFFGELSITSMFLLLALVLSNIFSLRCVFIKYNKFATIIFILGCLLYSSTLGFVSFDVYALGYFPNLTILTVFGVIALYLWYFAKFYAYIWLLGLIGFYFKLHPSNNLWDYLFDLPIWILSAIVLILNLRKIFAFGSFKNGE